jgi:hypothetical protein
MLDGAFPGQCWHAFIPAADATAQLATRSAHRQQLESLQAVKDACHDHTLPSITPLLPARLLWY